ncbi:S8 family serine peptidase [Aliiglaciecola sp. 2_MG-2023]|uniref:S8 family serine peptidase n=1 Tax=unclassified Aliiglaciecola TaxID=2593648 RepID=UPI0026E2DE40|nr:MULTISPECIES: S8 family serine peptidase [unclassified Aliiglaciecola]MDO6712530.1 S8 family serine peptidase [Aliiglaciecola sp. 2_MG-2023]MDO6753726.1 S8 family serine peptidase [Aliiglaciecola sp. 1_MG-2023]
MNNKKFLISALGVAVMSITQTMAAQPSPNLQFAEWLASQNPELNNQLTDRLIVKFKNQTTLHEIETASTDLSSESEINNGLSIAPGQISAGSNLLTKLATKTGQQMRFVKTNKQGRAILKLDKRMSKAAMQSIILQMQQDPLVESVEADPIRYLMAQSQPWGIANVQADQLSDVSAGGKTVCIIDSGYDINNPDLSANSVSGSNNSGTGNWYVPGGSHGTHVAGTIAGINNAEGIVGVLPNQNINLHIIKVFNESGWGYSSDLVDAVETCEANGADVVNMSLGGAGSSTSESNRLTAVANNGVLLVAAAGNAGDSSHSYPASYSSVISVAAVDETGLRAEFSQYTNQVELSAPGEAILSTVGINDGRQGYLTFNGTTLGDDRVLPPSRYIVSGGSYAINNINGSVSGVIGACSTSSSGSFSCSNMSNKICVVERADNQAGSTYPEINAALACDNAGAAGIVIYSNAERPGLQNPFLVDDSSQITVPTVSVNRTLGQQLIAAAGTSATLQVLGNTDYAYYNGTSMASPHVAGVAALVWANNPSCSASQVRSALGATAFDLESTGRDNQTGYGLVQAKAASDYLAANCSGNGGGDPGGNVLINGTAVTGLSGASNSELLYSIDIPEGASDLVFSMSGGSGDADLYVKYATEPSTNSYDCRPYLGGNNESCSVDPVQAGTYYVKIIGYSAYSGVSIQADYTESAGGGGNDGSLTVIEDISASRRNWVYYTVEVPAGSSVLDVSTNGGSGDADLYVRYGSNPTTGSYDCRPYQNGNTESCSFNSPQTGTWYVGIRAYSTFSNLTLTMEVQP